MTANSSTNSDRAVLFVRSVCDAGHPEAEKIAAQLAALFDEEYGFSCQQFFAPSAEPRVIALHHDMPPTEFGIRFMSITGPFAAVFADSEVGVHLIHQTSGTLLPIQIGKVVIASSAESGGVDRALRRFLELRQKWIEGVETHDPCALGRVLQIHDARSKKLLDLRSGVTASSPLNPGDRRRLAAASFPAPPELGS